MQPSWTRDCTEVILEAPDEDDQIQFARRAVHRINHFPQKIFCSQDRFDDEQVKAALTHVFEPPKQVMQEEPTETRLSATSSRKELINRKRQFI